MNKRKVTILVVSFILAFIISLNLYSFVNLNKERDMINEESKKVDSEKEQLNVLISQLLNKSSQYASHEDMINAFNKYSSSNSILYKGDNYYADVKRISSHTYNENEKVRYTAQAEMTFLKDEIVNNMSYIQNELPVKLMEESKRLVENRNTKENGDEQKKSDDVLIPQVDLIAIEKKAKQKFEVYKWSQALSFNMDGANLIQPTTEMEQEILKEFIKGLVLTDENLEVDKVEIETSEKLQTIKVKTTEKTFVFTYDKVTKELKGNQ